MLYKLFYIYPLLVFLFCLSCSEDPVSSNDDKETGTVTDIDGNVYQTIKIGEQWWMAENLKVTHYQNGDSIAKIIDNTEWHGHSTGIYCSYDNNDANISIYGLLYNWYAVGDSRNLAPEGWHVPTDDEWQELVDYLGGRPVSGGKLKEEGTSHWQDPNTGATNESGFTGLPSGMSNYDGTFYNIGKHNYWWSSTPDLANGAWFRGLNYNNIDVGHTSSVKVNGFSVRCIKD